MRLSIAASVVILMMSPAQAKEKAGIGFNCRSTDGSQIRLNINLRKKTYDAGEGRRPLYQVSDLKLVLRGPNPDLALTTMGPIVSILELDRRTLVLTDQLLAPERGINRTVTYQCVIVPVIDFKSDRAF